MREHGALSYIKPTHFGEMKKIFVGAAIFGVLFFISAFICGRVVDKGAVGVAGQKQFQLLVDYNWLGLGRIWLPVPERVWDRCNLGDDAIACSS
jgi:hypothetical protein